MWNGIFLINKPANMSSAQLVAKLKYKFKPAIKKIGHAGTLDPFATGLMVVLVNEATKLAPYLLNQPKTYNCQGQLFWSTTTNDYTGKLVSTHYRSDLTFKQLLETISSFPKTYNQQVPLYSAVKLAGKPAYYYARKAKSLPKQLPSKLVNLYQLHLNQACLICGRFNLTVSCSAGTYIRQLIVDLGQKLAVPATTLSLTRTIIGKWNLLSAQTITTVQSKHLLPLASILRSLFPIITLDSAKIFATTNILTVKSESLNNAPIIAVFINNKPYAICERINDHQYQLKRGFNNDDSID